MRPKKVEVGQFFLVPNSCGSFYLGQVAEEFPEVSSVFCYFFDEPDVAHCPQVRPSPSLSKRIIAAALVTPELLKRGVWEVCDFRAAVPQHELLTSTRALRADGFVGATVNSASLVAKFLDTHFGRLPLEHWATPHLVLRFLAAASSQSNN
jgi:hypothetical protein